MSFTLLQEQLHAVLDTLSEREAGVVSMRFGLTDGQPKTLDEIGKVYGVTRERIRQIESKTMSKLRHPSRSAGAARLPGLTGAPGRPAAAEKESRKNSALPSSAPAVVPMLWVQATPRGSGSPPSPRGAGSLCPPMTRPSAAPLRFDGPGPLPSPA